MTLAVSRMYSCGMSFNGVQLRIIASEAGRRYWNVSGRGIRVNNFLLSRVSKIYPRSKHKLVEKLLEGVSNYRTTRIERPKLLKEVSVLVGDDGSRDGAVDDHDVSSACKRYPSVILGSSPPIDLYDNTSSSKPRFVKASSFEEYVPTSIGEMLMDSDGQEICYSLYISPSPMELSYFSYSHQEPMACESRREVFWEESSEEVEKSVSPRRLVDAVLADLLLDSPISCIPRLSKRHFRQLENCCFYTLRKLLHHFPRSYADLQNARIEIEDGQYLIFIGQVQSSRAIRASPSFSFLEVVVSCEITDNESQLEHETDEIDGRGTGTIFLHLKKFFRGTRFTYKPFLQSLQGKHKEGETVCVSGKVKSMGTKNHYEMREYTIDVLEDEEDSSLNVQGRPYPLYPSKGGLKPNFLRDIIVRALQVLSSDIDPIPKDITEEFGLLSLHDAYMGIHQPRSMEEADLARKRIIFDEFFYLQLGRLFQMLEGLGTEIEKNRLLDQCTEPELSVLGVDEWSDLTRKLLKALPYSLTSSQLQAASEIIWDLKQPVPMNRLLQGDVGCGKTVVAFLACMEVISSGYQAAFMVPTELLAIQHYEHLLSLLEKMEVVEDKPSIALLTGSTPSKHSRLIRQGLQSGDILMVIGTHSLISEGVEFSALRIAVVDEQHRFGVVQRGRFNSKLYNASVSSKKTAASIDGSARGDIDMAPHVLAMSATPIPRTLALALYGDMSLTQITDLPPGRTPVETYIFEGNENGFEDVYKMMLDELEEGGKIYVVYPVIEQSEQLPQLRAAAVDFEAMSRRFQGYSCGLLHGKMKSDEKDEALRCFRSGETHVLLSTQVIEIGVDVPDASMMVVMNAERFGIAQLHQLRGRVGRGMRKSKCILLASTASSLNRLKVLEKSSDGFHLANVDLLLRGPGDLLGKKQSGHLPEFPITRLEIDGNLLQDAHLAALKVLSISHDLERFPKLKAELSMRQPLCILGD